jgi:AraC-like DNA-binding protein
MEWLPGASVTVEPARSDMARCAGGGIIRSSVATRYQLAPMRWLANQRLLEARRLLEVTNLPVDDVAERCGLGGAATLRVHLGRQSGTTPTAYRSSHSRQGPRSANPIHPEQVAWISYLHEMKTPDADWFELAVMHHTDCGSALFADEDLRHGFAARCFNDAELAALAVLDPAATVPGDVEKIINAPQVSPAIKVSGYSYDIKTGLVTTIVPARSRQDS